MLENFYMFLGVDISKTVKIRPISEFSMKNILRSFVIKM